MKSFKDIYKFPLVFIDKDYYTRIHDSADNFVFEFTFYQNYEKAKVLLDAINGEKTLKNKGLSFIHEDGCIKMRALGEILPLIKIRGWGNLTGIGGHNLSPKIAANIQDTFADYIVEQLNKRS